MVVPMDKPVTSDPEWVDVVDGRGRPLRRETRATVHREGLWHPTVHVWVMVPRREPHVVFQWRTEDRAEFAGLLDVTCGGHIGAGEEPLAAMRRELKEELGLGSRAAVTPLGAVPIAADGAKYQVREWSYEYLHVSGRPLSRYHVAAEEVRGLLSAPLSRLARLWSLQVPSLSMSGCRWEGGRPAPVTRTVTIQDFVPAGPEHYADLAKRLAKAYDQWRARARPVSP